MKRLAWTKKTALMNDSATMGCDAAILNTSICKYKAGTMAIRMKMALILAQVHEAVVFDETVRKDG